MTSSEHPSTAALVEGGSALEEEATCQLLQPDNSRTISAGFEQLRFTGGHVTCHHLPTNKRVISSHWFKASMLPPEESLTVILKGPKTKPGLLPQWEGEFFLQRLLWCSAVIQETHIPWLWLVIWQGDMTCLIISQGAAKWQWSTHLEGWKAAPNDKSVSCWAKSASCDNCLLLFEHYLWSQRLIFTHRGKDEKDSNCISTVCCGFSSPWTRRKTG